MEPQKKQDCASLSTERWLIISDVYPEVPWQNYVEDLFLIGAGSFILISLMAGLLLPPAVNIEPSKESSSLCRRLAFDVFIVTGLDRLCILIYLIASVFSFISLMAEGWTYFFSVCTGHLYIIICKLSVNIPRPSINWMNPFSLFNLLSSLYVLCITPLLDGYLTYFSYSLGSPLVLLIIFFCCIETLEIS